MLSLIPREYAVQKTDSSTNILTEENQDLRKQVAELKKENAELKEFINAPHTKGRKTTRGDYIKTVWDLSKKLAEAKELLKRFIETSNPISFEEDRQKVKAEAEQFISEVEK